MGGAKKTEKVPGGYSAIDLVVFLFFKHMYTEILIWGWIVVVSDVRQLFVCLCRCVVVRLRLVCRASWSC